MPPPLVRILVLSNKCPPDYDGGYELSAFQVAGALRGRGHDVQLLTSHYRPTYKGEKGDPGWVRRIFHYEEWPSIHGKGFDRSMQDARRVALLTNVGVANAARLEKHLNEHDYDLAYCFGLHGIGLATAHALAVRKIPILWHAGNYLIAQDMQLKGLFKRQRLAHRIGANVLAPKALKMIQDGDYSHIAFLSDAMRREFVRMGFEPKRSYIIPRGIDFPLAEDLDRPRTSPPVLLMASRVAEEKGYGVALQAARLLQRSRPDLNWELHIAGPGRPEYLAQLKAQAETGGIADRVRFLGMLKRDETLAAMRNATVFISASLWEEPFGRTNIEALACGVPLVAADTGAIREIVADSGGAVIYEKNDPNALTNALESLLASEDLRLQVAESGIERIKQAYTMDRILNMTEQTFASVLEDYR